MPACAHVDARDIARKELRGFVATAQRAGLDQERLRRFVRVSPEDWQGWLRLLQDEPLPAGVRLPVFLRHIGYLHARLDRVARAA